MYELIESYRYWIYGVIFIALAGALVLAVRAIIAREYRAIEDVLNSLEQEITDYEELMYGKEGKDRDSWQ